MPRPIREPQKPKIKILTLYRQYNIKNTADSNMLDYVLNEDDINSSVLTTYFNNDGHFQVVVEMQIAKDKKEILEKVS